MNTQKKAILERLFSEHRTALQAFFHRRIRISPDAPDLAQEVYLRMLRINNIHAIRNPELYLYTVANNLMKEHAAIDRRSMNVEDIESLAVQEQLADLPSFEREIDANTRTQRMLEVLQELPLKCRACVVLQFRYGLTYHQIGARLGVSPHMVKKYLAQALGHCRRRMQRLR